MLRPQSKLQKVSNYKVSADYWLSSAVIKISGKNVVYSSASRIWPLTIAFSILSFMSAKHKFNLASLILQHMLLMKSSTGFGSQSYCCIWRWTSISRIRIQPVMSFNSFFSINAIEVVWAIN